MNWECVHAWTIVNSIQNGWPGAAGPPACWNRRKPPQRRATHWAERTSRKPSWQVGKEKSPMKGGDRHGYNLCEERHKKAVTHGKRTRHACGSSHRGQCRHLGIFNPILWHLAILLVNHVLRVLVNSHPNVFSPTGKHRKQPKTPQEFIFPLT